jgi:hypothetical protein
MARKTVPRSLTKLPNRAELSRASHKTEALTEILRKVAAKNQREQPRAFYSLREVAAHFRVPFSTVARVYRTLEKEGLLSRVRGSKAILQGLHFDRHLSVRAFVGLPASLSAFVTIQEYRNFFIKIRRELRLAGFATAMVFFEKEEASTGGLSQRLKDYEVDTVLWFQPKETALRLSDFGIRLIAVAHGQHPVIPCRYQVRRENAIRTLLADWKKGDAIGQVTLVQWKAHHSATVEQTLQTILDELGIKWSVATFGSQRSEAFIRTLQKAKGDGIIFSSLGVAAKLSFRSPSVLTELLQSHRVAFICGPVSMPFAKVPATRVDLVTVDWQLVAERIANDLITQEAFLLPGPTIFEAEVKLCAPLSDFAQNI